MRKIVIMPGGFHPFHAGHAALYKSAVKAFNDADVYVAATNDTKTRPFPFAIKEKLAKLAGVADKHFIQVKSPFQPREITDHYNPEEDVLIFVRSEKDRNESPKPGGTKKDGTPAYFQPWTGKNVQPFGKQAYIAYLPTVEFGPGITSATEIRNAWPTLNDKRKTAMVMSLYPATQKNPKLAANVVRMLDMGMGNELAEGSLNEFVPPSSDRGGGGDDRSRRIRKLLEIAIQVAKEKNVDELGMIHAMNMIAGDEFFNTAVEGILPDITDKEYMFVLQSAYKTVKQGMAEGVNPEVTSDKYTEPSQNVRMGNFVFNARTFTGGLADPNAKGLQIRAYDPKNLKSSIGSADFIVKKDKKGNTWLESDDTEVNDKYRGKGVATMMYAFAKSLGNDIKPGDYKSYAGAKMWNKWGKDAKHLGEQNITEGDVVPFKQPSKALTWKQVPKDILLLANDWFWASEDNSGLDATLDPEGFGNGTANDVKYNAAKLQQKGWTIDYNYEYDGPGEFNLRLTNKRGQTVLLSIEDAQTFTGWAKGTSQYDLEETKVTKNADYLEEK